MNLMLACGGFFFYCIVQSSIFLLNNYSINQSSSIYKAMIGVILYEFYSLVNGWN
jgi:hypothetical protein